MARRGPQLRIRLRRIKGLTRKGVLTEPLRLPVVLGESFEITEDAAWEDFQTVGEGEVSSAPPGRKSRMLQSFDSETMTLTWHPGWMPFPEAPIIVRRTLRQILRSHTPVHLTAIVGPGGSRPEFIGPVTLRSMGARLAHGEPDARYYTLTFRQYREFGVERRGRRARGGGGDTGKGMRPEELPTKHRLKSGDTLRSIARYYYGRGDGWRNIARRNGIKNWGSEDPLVRMKRYKPGDRITIPKAKLGPEASWVYQGGSSGSTRYSGGAV